MKLQVLISQTHKSLTNIDFLLVTKIRYQKNLRHRHLYILGLPVLKKVCIQKTRKKLNFENFANTPMEKEKNYLVL